jgi:hypothetical protein
MWRVGVWTGAAVTSRSCQKAPMQTFDLPNDTVPTLFIRDELMSYMQLENFKL